VISRVCFANISTSPCDRFKQAKQLNWAAKPVPVSHANLTPLCRDLAQPASWVEAASVQFLKIEIASQARLILRRKYHLSLAPEARKT
jgi:hypothetical protein